VHFLEIGIDKDHVHFWCSRFRRIVRRKIITLIKSITAREVFRHRPEIEAQLWGGEFWTDGYFVNAVSKFGDEDTISKYVKEQGIAKSYKVLHKSKQLVLFWRALDTPLLAAGLFILRKSPV